jgi:hypothetical protein
MSEEATMSFLNEVTIDCLVNKELFHKNIVNKKKIVNKKDKKFYRKRIFNLVKELLTKKEDDTDINYLLPDVKYAFDNFMNSCIHYFKSLDNNDLIQESYKDMNNINNMNNINEFENDIQEEIMNQEEANNLLMKKIIVKKPTLDKFIKKNQKPIPSIEIPKQKEINLKDPQLRIKGISSGKKKNITNKYDEILNTKKENEKKIENNEKK